MFNMHICGLRLFAVTVVVVVCICPLAISLCFVAVVLCLQAIAAFLGPAVYLCALIIWGLYAFVLWYCMFACSIVVCLMVNVCELLLFYIFELLLHACMVYMCCLLYICVLMLYIFVC